MLLNLPRSQAYRPAFQSWSLWGLIKEVRGSIKGDHRHSGPEQGRTFGLGAGALKNYKLHLCSKKVKLKIRIFVIMIHLENGIPQEKVSSKRHEGDKKSCLLVTI